MPTSRTGTCRRAGFTLIELIIVIFILTIVMSIVMPSFDIFGEGRLKSEAKEIASILRYVNDSATSRKETFSIKFDLDKNIISWRDPEGEKTKKFNDMIAVTTQSNGRISSGELTVFFDPPGIRENLSVHMMRENKNMTVTLNHLSGVVKIVQNEK